MQCTSKQRDEANAKAWIVEQYHQSGLSPDDFIARYNADNPHEDALNKSRLYRWQRKYANKDVAALVDQRGGHNRGKSSISEDAWDYFYALYMTQQRRTVKRCYDLTKAKYPDIPSVSAFERRVRRIPNLALTYYRMGEKAFQDMLPSMIRDKRDITSNDIWFSDHHRVDVFVKSPDGKHVVRPWLTTFFDARSNRVVGRYVRIADPDSTAVKQCFRLAAEQNGIPNEVYFDNGKDYRSKYFRKDYPLSLANQLGIDTIYATPYHGQAKTVERFFGTFTDRFSRLFPTYTGKDAKERPECMRVSDAKIFEQAPTLEEYIGYLDTYLEEYNATPSSGSGMDGKSPDEVYMENLETKRVIADYDALRLLCGRSEERTVQKNGVSILNNSYFNEALLFHVGERVIVTYDPSNIDEVAVLDLEGRAICMADAKIRTPFRHTSEEDYKKAAKEKKAARALVKQYAPKREMSIQEIIARNQFTEKKFDETGDAAIVEQVTPQAARNAEILKKSNAAAARRRIREEGSISDILMEPQKKQA